MQPKYIFIMIVHDNALPQWLYVYIQTLKCQKLQHGVDVPTETQDVQFENGFSDIYSHVIS